MQPNSDPIQLLAAEADPAWVRLRLDVHGDAGGFAFDAEVRLPDGELVTFALETVVSDEAGVRVREREGERQLPLGCPQRHINGDGSFCLGLDEVPKRPDTEMLAATWWGAVQGFLWLQTRATLTGRWLAPQEWAHGDAALWQQKLEELEAALPPALVDFSRRAAVVVRRGTRRVVGRSGTCPCGRGLRLKRCHEAVVVELVRLRDQQEAAERAYWAGWRRARHPCCCTMQGCPLAVNRSGFSGDSFI